MTGDGPDTADSTGSLESGAASSRDPGLPRRIGHYTVKRLIGSGGMGAVYEAVQEQPRRVVALKVLRAGIAGKSALRRFEYESQLLARLRHPGIAQVYEAGTHESEHGAVPFFAMEYIPGARAITDFAAAKKLGTRERMELIARVCDAVHHGHQKGIIHRDLKPGNILVDSAGDPKIIDFGVARATDSDMAVTTLQTDIGQLIGTLAYMSPEQCAADPHDIDVRSDVYALGIVLYELLCGRMPYDVSKSAIAEATRKIREEEPAKLSTLDRTLRGDPETIVLKALEKERERRYRSAADLADDIRRYLKGEPISARPASVAYQVRVFAKRHRVLVGAVAAVVLVTTAAAVVSGLFAAQAMRARYAARASEEKTKLALADEEDARARAEAETANARFRLSTERARAIEMLRVVETLMPLARRAHDLSQLAPPELLALFPDSTIADGPRWLHEQFPDLIAVPDVPGRPTPVPKSETVDLRILLGEFPEYASEDPRRAAAIAWTSANADRFDALVAGIRDHSLRFQTLFHSTDDPLAAAQFPQLGSCRLFARVLRVRAVGLHEEGRDGAAVATLDAGRRLARDLGGSGLAFQGRAEYLIRAYMDATFRDIVVESAPAGKWAPEARRYIETNTLPPPAGTNAILEVAMVRQMIDQVFTRSGADHPARFDPSLGKSLILLLEQENLDMERCAEVDYEGTVRAFEEYLRRIRPLNGLSEEEIGRADTESIEALLRDNPILNAVTPRLIENHVARARSLMEWDATIITAALASWRATHGSWPASIDEAVGAIGVSPSRRDYYGHDFVYRVENDRPVLYSVGPDGKDDGGVRKWNDLKRDGGDLVYIAPADAP